MASVVSLFGSLDLGDWASIGTLFGLVFAIFEFRQQRRDRATDEGFSLLERAGVFWEKIHLNTERQPFYVGELLAFYEVVCSVYVEKRISRCAREVLQRHLIGALSILATTPHLRRIVIELKTHPAVFEDTVRFLQMEDVEEPIMLVFKGEYLDTETKEQISA